YEHGLKYVVNPASFARLVAAEGDDLAAISDEDLAPFADNYFEYDEAHRATREIAAAAGNSPNDGQGDFSYSYTTSGNGDGYNSWQTKTIETLPDGNQNIVYTNYVGLVMLRIFKDTTTNDTWPVFHEYDAAGHVILTAEPSAISGYNDTYADLLHFSSGD